MHSYRSDILLVVLLIAAVGLFSGCSGIVKEVQSRINDKQISNLPLENEKQETELSESAYKAASKRIIYESIARHPEKYASEKVFFTGQVVQVNENKQDVVLRVAVTEDEFGIWEDVVWVNYKRPQGEERILEQDMIQFWGEIKGLRTYEAVLGHAVSIPEVTAKYLSLDVISDEIPQIAGGQPDGRTELAVEQPKIVTSSKQRDEEAFKAAAQYYTYTEIARNPEKLIGQPLYLYGEVLQVMGSGEQTSLLVAVTSDGYGGWEDLIWVNYLRPAGSDRILEDDFIQIWGEVQGLKSYEAVLGNEMLVPEVNAWFMTIDMYEEDYGYDEADDGYWDSEWEFYYSLYAEYEIALIAAINSGDFAYVEYMLFPNSDLYRSQKALVENLYARNIKEELIDYTIYDAEYDPNSGEIRLLVNEVVKVIKPDGENLTDYTWIYVAQWNDDGYYQFSDIMSYEAE